MASGSASRSHLNSSLSDCGGQYSVHGRKMTGLTAKKLAGSATVSDLGSDLGLGGAALGASRNGIGPRVILYLLGGA